MVFKINIILNTSSVFQESEKEIITCHLLLFTSFESREDRID